MLMSTMCPPLPAWPSRLQQSLPADPADLRFHGREEVAELQRMSSPQLLAALARDPLASLDPEPSGHSPCHSSDAAVRLWRPSVCLRCKLILVA